MKWLLCGLVTVEKFHGDDVPRECGEDLEDLRALRTSSREAGLQRQWMHEVLVLEVVRVRSVTL